MKKNEKSIHIILNETEAKSFLEHNEVNYMEIYTQKTHFIIAENNQNVENNNNAVDDKTSNAFSKIQL